LLRGALKDGWALYRIGDSPWGQKPFDIGGSTPEGHAVALEVKMVVELGMYAKFPWDIFADHQLRWLNAFARFEDSLGIIAIYESKHNTMKLFFPSSKQICTACVHEIPKVLLQKTPNDGYRGWRSLNVVRP
jgi:hypothetical protein